MAKPVKTPIKKTSKDPNQDPNQDGEEGNEDPGEEGSEDPEEENRRINAIVTSRVKREMKGVMAQLSTITEALKGLSNPKPGDDDDDDDGDAGAGEHQETQEQGKKPAKDPEMDTKTARKLTKLERELAEERAERIKAQKERTEEQERNRKNELRAQFQAALTEHGITDPRLMRAALTQLEEDGFMIRDEEGKAKFKGVDKYGIETIFEPKAGVKTWVLGEGKSFVPAVDAGGSGSNGARSGAPGSNVTKGEYSKLTPAAKASIELERASQGLPPLE